MNKSIFIYLLILVILDAGCETTACPAQDSGSCSTPSDFSKGYECIADGDNCKKISICENAKGKNCDTQKVPDGYKCQKKSDTSCELTSTATNSSKALNIFKITFGLLIIFIIL